MEVTFTLELTEEQQVSYAWVTGTRKATLVLPQRKLGMLALAATAAGRDVLPLSSSTNTIRYMLHPEQHPEGAPTPWIVWLRLTASQSEQIRVLTGRQIRMVAFAPEEVAVSYAEIGRVTQPFALGRTFTVAPVDCDMPAPPADRVIRLPASMSEGVFGTGRHPATRAALLALEDYLRPGDTVLDVGTGSGILAVAAVRLGARAVLGVDIDAGAVALARELVTLNGAERQVELREGSIELAESQYDLVLMNLFPQVIMELAPALGRIMRADARIVTSGAVEVRTKRLARSLAGHGFAEIDRRADRNWIAQIFEHSPAPVGTRP